MSEIQDERLYSLKKTAEILSVSVQTLRNWDFVGKFKANRTIGNHRRYHGKQIKEFIDSSRIIK